MISEDFTRRKTAVSVKISVLEAPTVYSRSPYPGTSDQFGYEEEFGYKFNLTKQELTAIYEKLRLSLMNVNINLQCLNA